MSPWRFRRYDRWKDGEIVLWTIIGLIFLVLIVGTIWLASTAP